MYFRFISYLKIPFKLLQYFYNSIYTDRCFNLFLTRNNTLFISLISRVIYKNDRNFTPCLHKWIINSRGKMSLKDI